MAPTNAVSLKHRARIDAYVRPEFGQDWRLFAPNPQQRNEAVGVRLRSAGENGAPALSGWVNLTAEDVETIRGSLAPSHAHQNMLRRAWDGYVNSHSLKDHPRSGPLSELSRTYLKRVVLQRIGREWQGRRIVAIQVAGRFTDVPPPSWHQEKAPDTTAYRMLPWWPVTDQDYREL
ncbi:DUF5819 family protein [Streptomyces cinnabarinus]|uniref:DUF5819 family protein n=1 Tax=Streptomyces cinnabarinus TaxID=67287 RepID=A0ABY7K4J0_9ACTN|nr:DUF5819 family protein [Streptomyces cinnabarinus]WAZ19058.1 DUF5819 family protein [Streptomyces cinnabarinus]